MTIKEKIEKVRIPEKDFPSNIPEDIGHKPLEVVNEAGEIVALFFDTAFMKKKKYKEALEFIKDYDAILDDVYSFINLHSDNWGDTMTVTVHADSEAEAEKHSTLDYKYFCDAAEIVNEYVLMMVFLGRLTYPYLFLDEGKCRDALFFSLYIISETWEEQVWNTTNEQDFTFQGYGDLLFEYDDLKLIKTLFNFLGNDNTIWGDIVGLCSKKLFLEFILTNGYLLSGEEKLFPDRNYPAIIHKHPEIFFTKETI
jgi:hypothetical protein